MDAALGVGLPGAAPIDARFVGVGGPPAGPWRRLASGLPVLGPRDLDLLGIRWYAVQGLRTRRLVEAALAEEAAEVVHIHSHSIALGLGRATRDIPVVLSADSGVWDWSAMGAWRAVRRYSRLVLAPTLAAERRALARAALVVAWTPWTAAGLLRASPAAKVVVNHPGLDLERFQPSPAREGRSRLRLLFVGGRFASKGGADLLTAAEPWLGCDVELDIVTKEAVELRDGVTVHDIDSSDPRLVSLYQQADVVCLPSYADAVPWTVLEAMACGVPVVASTVGGIPDLLERGHCGLLVAPGDIAGLRAAIERLLGDSSLRARLGAAGRARCETGYDARRQIPKLVELLASVAASDPANRR